MAERASGRLTTMPQLKKAAAARPKRRGIAVEAQGASAAQESLTRAFLTFTQAAGSLEKSYAQLQAEVSRLSRELQRTNSELDRSLEENARMRGYLSRVLESLPCGVLVLGADQQVQVVNPEAQRLLGLPGDCGERAGNILPEAFAKKITEISGGKALGEQEWAIAAGGAQRYFGITRADVSIPGQSEGDTIWIVRDVTEAKRVAAEREAARRSNALAEVATVLAHEIRNPLGSMELFTGLLADATAHMPETRQWVTHLQAGLRALSATVNNVLQFHSQPAAQMVPVELDRLVQETMEFLAPLARQRGQQTRLENTIGKIAAQADANRLKQVFLNLSLNAFRAMRPGGTLTVKLRRAPQFPTGIVQIDFQDDGRGIAPELLEQIFEPGFTTTPGSPGLGLSVCKKVIEQHGGEVRVQSKPPQGSTFSLYLPMFGEQA